MSCVGEEQMIMDYLMMKSDEKAILLEKEGSNDPSFFIKYYLRNSLKYLKTRVQISKTAFSDIKIPLIATIRERLGKNAIIDIYNYI